MEKILAQHENLREDWPVQGTTGYEFANLVLGLLIDPAGEEGFTRTYTEFTGGSASFAQVVESRIPAVDAEGLVHLCRAASKAPQPSDCFVHRAIGVRLGDAAQPFQHAAPTVSLGSVPRPAGSAAWSSRPGPRRTGHTQGILVYLADVVHTTRCADRRAEGRTSRVRRSGWLREVKAGIDQAEKGIEKAEDHIPEAISEAS